MVVGLDPLELDVDKVLGVKRTSQNLVWLRLLCRCSCVSFEVIFIEKPTTQNTADGRKVFSHPRLFSHWQWCFCRVEFGLRNTLVGRCESTRSRKHTAERAKVPARMNDMEE